MKQIMASLKVFAIVLVVLFLGLVGLHRAVRLYVTFDAKQFRTLLRDAESVIMDVGGCAILASEASRILANTTESNRYLHLNGNDWVLKAPAIYKTQEKLSPNVRLWVVSESYPVFETMQDCKRHKIEIPEHVVIRFGTHSSYAWILIFAMDKALTELPQGIVRIGESVYLSPRNM